MNAADILSVLDGILKDAAKAFPDDLHVVTKCYFEDEACTKYFAYPDTKKSMEAWGELTVYSGDAPDEDEDESETTYTFSAMVAVKSTGEVDAGEVEEVKKELADEIAVFMQGVSASESFEAFLRLEKEEADKAYKEMLEKYERSMKQMKKIVYGCAAVAAVIFVLLVIVKAIG